MVAALGIHLSDFYKKNVFELISQLLNDGPRFEPNPGYAFF
jgi:hypothetical protein